MRGLSPGLALALVSLISANPVGAQITEANTAPPASAPAEIVVPAAEIGRKPVFVSGPDIEQLPEVIAATKTGGFADVSAKAIVGADGSLRDIALVRPSGVLVVDTAIVRALASWRLTRPTDKQGKAVATMVNLPFSIGKRPPRVAGAIPEMPAAARAAFHNGKAIVRARIDETGAPVDIKLVRSSRSELIDAAMLSAVAAFRYQPPRDLNGRPTQFDIQVGETFTQAQDGGGSYITGLRSYSCAAFISETRWWQNAHPESKLSDLEFYQFLSGLAYIAPEALGIAKPDIRTLSTRHASAWQGAVTSCAANGKASFLAEYRKALQSASRP